MKRTILLLLSLCLVFSLSSCGVSQTDYDALLSENNSLKSEIETLSSENESLSSKNETLLSENEALSSENETLLSENQTMLNEIAAQFISDFDDNFVKVWATTSFGDDSICFTDGDSYFQCISGKTYTISEEGLIELLSDLFQSAKTLQIISENTTIITYETISIKFLDPSGTHIMDVTLKDNGEYFSLDNTMCNINYLNQFLSAVNNFPDN